MTVSNETIMIILAFIINYVYVLNFGQGIHYLRRFFGAIITVAIGIISVFYKDSAGTSVEFDAYSYMILMICIVYFFIQLFICIQQFMRKDTNIG